MALLSLCPKSSQQATQQTPDDFEKLNRGFLPHFWCWVTYQKISDRSRGLNLNLSPWWGCANYQVSGEIQLFQSKPGLSEIQNYYTSQLQIWITHSLLTPFSSPFSPPWASDIWITIKTSFVRSITYDDAETIICGKSSFLYPFFNL